ncbi:MAG: hypothetical protein NWF06_01800 [Candidatus Bathyarchaeota archaeon]|nr:hypothetical protein [Candidatus Bathyarchaeum sp.]
MKVAKNVNAISRLLFILMLLLALIIGSIFSYLVVAGYYLNLGIEVPENPTVSVIDIKLDIQNAESFNITILNPTYSPTDATIKEISVITEDDKAHSISSTEPELPYTLDVADQETFLCNWNWGDYLGETVDIIVLVEDGSGAVYQLETISVGLEVESATFTSTDTKHFNLTISNPEASALDFNVTKVTLTLEDGTETNIQEIKPSVPELISTGTSTTFVCTWDWTDYRGMNVTITVYTLQGYAFYLTESTPKAAQILVTDLEFDSSTLTHFDITVKNYEYSIEEANLTTVEVLLENEFIEVSVVSPGELPYLLPIGESVTLTCYWDWSDYRETTVGVTVETSEGFVGYTYQTTP